MSAELLIGIIWGAFTVFYCVVEYHESTKGDRDR